MTDSWLRQEDEALYQDLLWSRPESKKAAGSILIVGGHVNNLMAPIKAFDVAKKNGIGKATVVMPESVPESILSPDVVTVASSKSGGISTDALNDIHRMITEVDAVLWPGAIGGDSETTRLLANLSDSESIPMTFAGDSLDSLLKETTLTERKNTHLVLTMSQLRTVGTNLKLDTAITSDIQLTNLVEILNSITSDHPIDITTYYENRLLTSSAGQASTTSLSTEADPEDFRWRIDFATISTVLMAQFPKQSFEAITTAGWLFKESDVRVEN